MLNPPGACAEQVIDSFEDLTFDFSGGTGTAPLEQSFVRSTPFGEATLIAAVIGCGIKAENGKLHFYSLNDGVGQAWIGFKFATPVNFSRFDYFFLDYDHTYSSSPVATIDLRLSNYKILERGNYSQSPIPPTRRKFPFYEFTTKFSSYVYHPTSVAEFYVSFSNPGTSGVTVDAVALGSVGTKRALSATIRRGEQRDLIVEGSRAVESDEMLRREFSFDLQNWYGNIYLPGDGTVPRFEHDFSDARFYRFAWSNKVPLE